LGHPVYIVRQLLKFLSRAIGQNIQCAHTPIRGIRMQWLLVDSSS